MSEKPPVQRRSSNPEADPGRRQYRPGDSFDLGGGTVIEVQYDNGDGKLAVLERVGGDGRPKLHFMPRERLDELAESLSTPEGVVSGRIQRILTGDDNDGVPPEANGGLGSAVAMADLAGVEPPPATSSPTPQPPQPIGSGPVLGQPKPAGGGTAPQPVDSGTKGSPGKASKPSGPKPTPQKTDSFDDAYSRLAKELGLDDDKGPEPDQDPPKASALEYINSEIAGAQAKLDALVKAGGGGSAEEAVIRDELDSLTRQKEAVEAVLNGPREERPKTTIEFIDSEIADKQAELDALSQADKAGPKGEAIERELDILREQKSVVEAVVNSQAGGKGDKPEGGSKKEKEEIEQYRAIRQEVMKRYEEERSAKIRRLAEIHAKLMTDRRGRRKNQILSKELEAELSTLDKNISTALIKAGEKAGRYSFDGVVDEEELKKLIREKKIDDAFAISVQTGRELFAQTNKQLEARQENLNVFQRFVRRVGGWMNKGYPRNYLTGFGAGFAPTATQLALGVSLPVAAIATGVVGAAGAVLTNLGSREAGIQDAVAARGNVDTIEDPLLIQLRKNIGAATKAFLKETGDKRAAVKSAEHATQEILASQRQLNIAMNERITRRSRNNTLMFLGGLASGTVSGIAAGNFIHGWFNSPAPQVSGVEGLSPLDKTPAEGLSPLDKTPATEHFTSINTNGAPEHAMRDLLSQSNVHGYNQHTLFNELYSQTGGNVFQTNSGGPVPMKGFGGNIGIGFTEWNVNHSVGFTEAAKSVLRAKGFTI